MLAVWSILSLWSLTKMQCGGCTIVIKSSLTQVWRNTRRASKWLCDEVLLGKAKERMKMMRLKGKTDWRSDTTTTTTTILLLQLLLLLLLLGLYGLVCSSICDKGGHTNVVSSSLFLSFLQVGPTHNDRLCSILLADAHHLLLRPRPPHYLGQTFKNLSLIELFLFLFIFHFFLMDKQCWFHLTSHSISLSLHRDTVYSIRKKKVLVIWKSCCSI